MHKTRTLFLVSLMTLLCVVGAFVFIFRVIAHKNEHTRAVVDALAEKMRDKENAETILKKVSEVNAVADRIDGYFVDSSNVSVFVEYLEKLGTLHKTTLQVKAVDVPTSVSHTIVFGVSIEGSFNDVFDTIAALENAPYQVHISQLYLNKETNPDADPKAKVKVTPNMLWHVESTFSVLSTL